MKAKKLQHHKKAQTEVFGIVIVVILVMLGMGFAIKSMLAPVDSTADTFKKAHLSQDLLNAISLSETTCQYLDMSGLIKECFTAGTTCGEPCEVVKSGMRQVLSNTLDRQMLAYRLRIYANDPALDSKIDIRTLKDDGDEIADKDIGVSYLVKERPGTLTLPLGGGGDVNIMLEIFTIRQVYTPAP